ncbi:MAG: hypothetical protein WCX64_06710 [Candidatus Micrarchaeia archaeon]|jgi:hypothetical protein
MEPQKRKYIVHGCTPFGKGHLLAVSGYSPDLVKAGKAFCELPRFFYSPEPVELETTFSKLKPHFVEVHARMSKAALADAIRRAHAAFGRK